jgi:hypothetical protein
MPLRRRDQGFLTSSRVVLRYGMSYVPSHFPTIQEILMANRLERHGYSRDARDLVPVEELFGGVANCEVRRGGASFARQVIELSVEGWKVSGDSRYLEVLSRLHRNMTTKSPQTVTAFKRAWRELAR